MVTMFLLAGWLHAQQSTATISGTIHDSSGAVIPGVTMTVTNVDTGLNRAGNSGADGTYKFPALPIGTYRIRAERSGFQASVQEGLKLNLGQDAVINITLQVGEVEQTVAVNAEAPVVETTTATVSGLVGENQIRDLPLNARNLIELATLFPGVTLARAASSSAANGFATKLTISGTRFNASLFQLDGQDINDATGSAGGAAGILMGVETIREFDVITHGFSAEYGKHTGGVFNAVTKSGTNSLHGSAFDFLRNNKLDARNFFDRQIPPYKRNQFGAALGGPIKKDKTFFFGSYEGLRQRLGVTQIFTVPDANAHQGILPTTAAICASGSGTYNAAAGLCTFAVNPAVKPFLDSFPLPNGQIFSSGTGEFTRPFGLPTNENFVMGRIDQRFSDKDSLFGRYTFDNANQVGPQNFNSTLNSNSRDQYITLGETHVFSPQLLNILLLAFNRSLLNQVSPAIPGFTYPLKTFTAFTIPLPTMAITTLSGWGANAIAPTTSLLNNYQVKDDLFYTRGDHSLKFGFNTERMQFLRSTYFNGAGQFNFSSLSDFVLGNPNQFAGMTADSDANVYPRQSLYALYAQDDIRVSPKLTVNVGMRYEFVTVPNVLHGRISNLHNYLTPGQTVANLTLGNPVFQNPSLHNFAPRVGFAWDPFGSGKTSIRGGVGIYYDQVLPGPFLFSYDSAPPFYRNANILAASKPQFPNAFFTQQNLLQGSPQTEPLQFNMQQPTVYKYSFGVQREIVRGTSLEAGFDGLRGVHLMRVIMANMPVAQNQDGRIFIPQTAPLVNPGFGRIRPKQSDGTSTYYAGRLQLTERLSRGLQLRASYSYSKALDDGSNWAGSTEWTNSPGQARYLSLKDKGPSAFDIRNAFTANFTYDLPGAQLAGAEGKLLGGWQTSGILSLQNGTPFTVTSGALPSWMASGFVGDFPDVIAGAHVKYNTRDPNHYFDPASAFLLPAAGIVGNAGRDILVSPGIASLNAVLVKKTRFRENLNLEFRAEFYNILNHANFGFPSGTGAAAFVPARTINPVAGRIVDTGSSTSRQVQLALKLEF